MKVSVSLSDDDVAFLDEFAATGGAPSRSAAVQRAIALLRAVRLEDAYAEAWSDWESEDGAEAWDGTAPDGLVDASR